MSLFFAFFVALVLSLIVTPLVSRFARENGLTDNPGERKIHEHPQPFLGGMSIFFSFGVTGLYFYSFCEHTGSLLLCALLIVILGFIDDLYNIKPLCKLAGQSAVAALYVALNAGSFAPLTAPLSRFYPLQPAALALIVCWIVLLINAFNLIDGLDGLAAGIAVVIFAALALLAFRAGHMATLGLLSIGMGACIGFLPYNFQPARIFLGDAGAMLIGFILAALHLRVMAAPFSLSTALGSVFIFAYPVLDVTFAVFRRLRRRQSIFQGDQGHIHHLLPRHGLSERRAVLLLYLGSVIFAVLALFLLSRVHSQATVLSWGAVFFAATALLFYRLICLEDSLPGIRGGRLGTDSVDNSPSLPGGG